ncbi:MAG TPA: hypothetical protein VEI52_25535 [Terriglobales bacterium]|nr:hypothetical protein [Terriglobales bacterium]
MAITNRCSKTSVFALACSMLAQSSAFGQGVPTESPEEQVLRGTVVNRLTHEPIGRALVFSPGKEFATLSDNDGHFALALPRSREGDAGKVNWPNALTALKPGFVEDPNQWYPAVPGMELTIAVTPEALVIGHVQLPSAEAMDGIEVEIYRRQVEDGRPHWVSAGVTRTKSNGEFRFAELAAGSYKLLTRELIDRDPVSSYPGGQVFGYPPAYFPNASDFSKAETIQLAAGQTVQTAISLVEQAYYPVKVPVMNVSAGTTVRVSVSPQGRQGPGYSLVYHDAGQIEGLLPNGSYTIEATSGEPAPRSGSVNIRVQGGAREGPRLIMVPNHAIPVNVKEEFTSPSESGSPAVIARGSKRALQGAYLRLYLVPVDDFDGRGRASLGSSSGAGENDLLIEDVRPGRYWVKVRSSRGYASSITSGGIDLEHQPLVVPARGPIEITMRDDWAEIDSTVEGIAAGSGGESPNRSGLVSPASSAHVYFVPQPDSPGEFREALVAPDGKLNLSRLPPGVYRVLVFDRPQADLEYHDPEAMRAYETEGPLLRLAPGQNPPLRLQVSAISE